MNVRKMSHEELELLSFTDIAYHIIKLDMKQKTTVELFKEICSLLKMSNKEYEDKIADFFTSLTTDKRFILLNSVNWDLKENHSIKTVIDDTEDELEDIEDEIEETEDGIEEKEESEEDFIDGEEELDDIDGEELDALDELEDIDEIDEIDEDNEDIDK